MKKFCKIGRWVRKNLFTVSMLWGGVLMFALASCANNSSSPVYDNPLNNVGPGNSNNPTNPDVTYVDEVEETQVSGENILGLMTWQGSGTFVPTASLSGFSGYHNDWAGYGIGCITQEGDKAYAYIDISKIKSFEFDVEIVELQGESKDLGKFDIAIENGDKNKVKDAFNFYAINKNEEQLETGVKMEKSDDGKVKHYAVTLQKEHDTWATYVYMANGFGNGFTQEKPLVVKNLKFLDKDGKEITEFRTVTITSNNSIDDPVTTDYENPYEKTDGTFWKSTELGGFIGEDIAQWGLSANEGWGAGTFDLETGKFTGNSKGTLTVAFANGKNYDITTVKKVEFNLAPCYHSANVTLNLGGINGLDKVEKTFSVEGQGKTKACTIEVGNSDLSAAVYLMALTTKNVCYITDIAFYDANGNQITSFTVDTNKKPVDDNREVGPNDPIDYNPTEIKVKDNVNLANGYGIMMWADGGVGNFLACDAYVDGFRASVKAGNWAGFGFGRVSADGSKISEFIDISKIKRVEFDVLPNALKKEVSVILENGSGASASKTTITVTTSDETQHISHVVTEDHSKTWATYLYMADGLANFDGENPVVVKNLKFYDAEENGNEITTFKTITNYSYVDLNDSLDYDYSKVTKSPGKFWKSFEGTDLAIWGVNENWGGGTINIDNGELIAPAGKTLMPVFGQSNDYKFDISSVKKVTFTVTPIKGSITGELKCILGGKKEINFAQEEIKETKTCELTVEDNNDLSDNTYLIAFVLSGGNMCYITDVEFCDKDGNAVTPKAEAK